MNGLWRDPAGRSLTENDQDHVFFEWVLANAARTVVDRRDPFFTDWLGAPHGVNLMANTSMWTATLPMAPVSCVIAYNVPEHIEDDVAELHSMGRLADPGAGADGVDVRPARGAGDPLGGGTGRRAVRAVRLRRGAPGVKRRA
jgi:hypothetical protein